MVGWLVVGIYDSDFVSIVGRDKSRQDFFRTNLILNVGKENHSKVNLLHAECGGG